MVARRSAAARADVPARGQTATPHSAPRAAAPRAATLDRLIHDRTRLAIVSALAVNAALTFNELKALTGTTDGNLSVHARKLEDGGYVAVSKGFEGRLPRTEFRLTAGGRRALQHYLDHMEAIIRHARGKGR